MDEREQILDEQMGPLLTPEEAAEFLKVTKESMAVWRCRKVGPRYVQISGTIRYPSKALIEYLRGKVVCPECDDARKV